MPNVVVYANQAAEELKTEIASEEEMLEKNSYRNEQLKTIEKFKRALIEHIVVNQVIQAVLSIKWIRLFSFCLHCLTMHRYE